MNASNPPNPSEPPSQPDSHEQGCAPGNGAAQPIAHALVQAWRSGHSADDRVFEKTALSPAQASAVQAAVFAALAGDAGPQAPRHWKSGGAQLVSISHAPLLPGGVVQSPADLRTWPLWHSPAVEAEIALRLGQPVDAALAATLTPETAAALVDAMAVAIELVGSRWRGGPQASAVLKLVDAQSNTGLVLGTWLPWNPGHDWGQQSCCAWVGDAPAVQVQGSHSLGNPAAVLLAWLRHATQGGKVLAASSVVTTGTWVGGLPVRRGEAVRVVFEGLGEAVAQL